MVALLLASNIALWLSVLLMAFLLLGILRSLELVSWRLDQLEATTPNRTGRSGLRPGKRAPDFTLPSITGGEVSLSGFAGRKRLLVFTQTGCGPCRHILPELNRLHDDGQAHVLVVNRGDLAATRQWANELPARFPVLVQDDLSVSRRYEVFATPFAFLINEQGVITSTGIIKNRQHIGFVLAGRRHGANEGRARSEDGGMERAESDKSESTSSTSKEVGYV